MTNIITLSGELGTGKNTIMIKNEDLIKGDSINLRNCGREEYISAISEHKADSFAKTFVSKADMQKQWDFCVGAFNEEGSLMGAIITTIGKRDPKVANLQLLHTFAKHRRKGVAKTLTISSYETVKKEGAVYFRVSAEPSAVVFYESIGFKFWGLQKSGSSLSMFAVADGDISNGIYNDSDPFIRKCLYSGRKGSLASSYRNEEKVDLEVFL